MIGKKSSLLIDREKVIKSFEFIKEGSKILSIENKKPVFGIIYMPTKNKLYFTKDKKSYFSKELKNSHITN